MNDGPSPVSTVGIVDGERARALGDAVESHGGDSEIAAAPGLASADVDVILAPTEASVYECVRARTTAPLLAIDGGPALRGVPRTDADTAISHLLSAGVRTVERRTLSVSTPEAESPGSAAPDGEWTRALADVTLITTEPARISEYAVHTNEQVVGAFRADGIVLATPVGSQGYARAAGSHVLAPNTGIVAAVPVAPFATHTKEWVLPDDEVTITVERNEGDISLRVDDSHHVTLSHTDRVTVTPDDPIAIAVTPESTGPWPSALEKH